MENLMTPNKRKSCLSAIKKANIDIDEDRVPETINRGDRNHFHVIMIDSRPNQEMGYDHRVRKQTFNYVSYEKFKENKKRITSEKAFLLHDATQQKTVEDRVNAEAKDKEDKANAEAILLQKEAQAKADADEKAKREIEAEENAKVEKEKAEAEQKLAEEKAKAEKNKA